MLGINAVFIPFSGHRDVDEYKSFSFWDIFTEILY